jgi:hypothetical protein
LATVLMWTVWMVGTLRGARMSARMAEEVNDRACPSDGVAVATMAAMRWNATGLYRTVWDTVRHVLQNRRVQVRFLSHLPFLNSEMKGLQPAFV